MMASVLSFMKGSNTLKAWASRLFMRNMILRQCFFKMQCVMFQVVIVAGYKKTRRQG